jgi:BA14K-like protein
MERRLGNDQTMMHKPVIPMGPGKCLMVAALTAFAFMAPASAQNYGERTLRYGNTSSFYYDSRNDDRDFPTNGAFPGNFAADPIFAAIGAAGFLESNPRRSAVPYPSQIYFEPARDRTYCRGYRSYDALSGTFLGKDGLRHRC